MSTVAITATTQAPAVPADRAWPAAQFWGVVLVAPYVLVFLVFVLYPVCYGFWIARRPESFAHLFDDPIFARSVANTLVFLIVGINLKMAAALMLSNFFVQARRWIQWLA
ncbi:MAG TPA: sugar ABC transporter permease, partial [Xanthobacteraceae bacterium]|nr:sugar ABC transporter permease [Xanthobacteraceae bacterium]